MMQNGKIKEFLGKNSYLLLIFLSLLFIGLRLPAIHFPYHQDEYKWVIYSHPELIPAGSVPHPPLTEFIYTKIGPLLGDMNFRFIPFSFGILNLFLIFYLVKFLFNKKTAQIAITIFTLSFFSLLSTLMIDVDGAIMPFFFLLLAIGYYKWKDSDFELSKTNYKWIILILGSAIGGILIKVSFILPIGSIFLDFLIEKKVFSDWKKILKYGFFAFLGVLALIGVLFLSKLIFPFFNLSYALKYWEHFIVWDRGWFQTAIQCIKAVLYASPFLIFIPFFADRKVFSKARVFLIFLGLSFIFYIVLFDFSLGALDRYLQLLILPLILFASPVLSDFDFKGKRVKEFLLLGLAISLALITLQFLPHSVPPLYPKTEWISRALSFKWNFLYPFSGGSGPLGFYVSFLFLSLSWIISGCVFLLAKFKNKYKILAITLLVTLGFSYNFVFIEEYLFGLWNGSAPRLLWSAVEFMKNDPDIEKVTVYNDNGVNDIIGIGKYRKRLYVDPKFNVDNNKALSLNTYKEHYFVLNIPRIDPNTIFQKYFDSCQIVYQKMDKQISATIYDCRNAPDIK